VLYLRAPDGVIFTPMPPSELPVPASVPDQPEALKPVAPQPLVAAGPAPDMPPTVTAPVDAHSGLSERGAQELDAEPVLSTPNPSMRRYLLPVLGVAGVLVLLLLASRFMNGGFFPFGAPIETPTAEVTEVSSASPTDEPSETPTDESPESPTEDSPGVPGSFTVENRGTDEALMVLMPEGEFRMGRDDGSYDEAPTHTVHLSGFWIDLYEVTNRQYKQCEDAGSCPSHRADSASRESYYGNSEYDHYPVIFVSWDDAVAYCEWAGKRLPTEAEWERAARGPDALVYPWGNDYDQSRVNANGVNDDTTEAGDYADGVSPYGVYDMAGNVHEWVSDWYSDSYYAESPSENPTGPDSGERRVLRGGGWDSDASAVQSTFRDSNTPDTQNPDIGFRCAQ
jgi:formylglycine-generating enzyme required for sulfatase activity